MKPLATRLAAYEIFFPAASLATMVVMALTVLTLDGRWTPPAGMAGPDWHAHEMLLGHFPAAFAGVMLTALPRWTGGPSVPPAALLALAALWLAARLAFLAAPAPALLWLSPAAVAAVGIYAGGRIVAAGDRRDLGLAALLLVVAVADGLFVAGVAEGDTGLGLRLALAAATTIAAVMGGRIVPALTRHLAASLARPVAAPPPPALERTTLALTPIALGLWAVVPTQTATAVALLAVTPLHLARLILWRGTTTLDRPPFLALHLGYAFLPLGMATAAAAILTGRIDWVDVAAHAFGAGVFGLMCAAVMASVVRRYAGHALMPSRIADLFLGLLLLATLARLAAGLDDLARPLLLASAAAWIAAYATMLVLLARSPRLPAPPEATVTEA